MINFFKKFFTHSTETFVVGYNEGLLGEKFFLNLLEALQEAKQSTALIPNVVVRDGRGRIIARYN